MCLQMFSIMQCLVVADVLLHEMPSSSSGRWPRITTAVILFIKLEIYAKPYPCLSCSKIPCGNRLFSVHSLYKSHAPVVVVLQVCFEIFESLHKFHKWPLDNDQCIPDRSQTKPLFSLQATYFVSLFWMDDRDLKSSPACNERYCYLNVFESDSLRGLIAHTIDL